jgi:hypothetical protein
MFRRLLAGSRHLLIALLLASFLPAAAQNKQSK